jgi:hypothetical protein
MFPDIFEHSIKLGGAHVGVGVALVVVVSVELRLDTVTEIVELIEGASVEMVLVTIVTEVGVGREVGLGGEVGFGRDGGADGRGIGRLGLSLSAMNSSTFFLASGREGLGTPRSGSNQPKAGRRLAIAIAGAATVPPSATNSRFSNSRSVTHRDSCFL